MRLKSGRGHHKGVCANPTTWDPGIRGGWLGERARAPRFMVRKREGSSRYPLDLLRTP